MRSTPTGRRPCPAFGYTGSISAHNSAHGTTCSISSRNSARRVFFVYRSNPLCAASVRCFIPRQSSDALLSIYPEHQWKMENLIRVSLGVLRSIADISTTADWAECPGRIRLSSADHGDLFTIAHSPILHSRDGAKWKGTFGDSPPWADPDD